MNKFKLLFNSSDNNIIFNSLFRPSHSLINEMTQWICILALCTFAISTQVFAKISLDKLWQEGDFWKMQTYDGHATQGIYYAVDIYYTTRNHPDLYKNSESGVQGRNSVAGHDGYLFLHLLDVTELSQKTGIPGNFQRVDANRVIQGLDPAPQNSFIFNDGTKDHKIDMEIVLDNSSYRSLYGHIQIPNVYFTSTVIQKIRNAVNSFLNDQAVGTPPRVAIDVGQNISVGTVLGSTNMWGLATGHHIHFQVFTGMGYSESSPYLGNAVDLSNASTITLGNQCIFDVALQAITSSGVYQFPSMPRRDFPVSSSISTNTNWDGGGTVRLRSTAGGTVIANLSHGVSGYILSGPQVAKIFDQTTWHVWWQAQFTGYQPGWIAAEYIDPVTSIDNPPVVISFQVTPTSIIVGNSITASYTVTDDIGLSQVELWRSTPDTSAWNEINTILLSGQTSYSGYFLDTPPTTGTFWYGVHVVDTKGNWSVEPKPPGPIEVIVNSSIVTEVETPTRFSLNQNFPNPFNLSTVIRYSLPYRCLVRLEIFNTLGQRIQELVNSEQNAGYQEVTWHANVSSGIYFYRIVVISIDNPSEQFVESKEMILLR